MGNRDWAASHSLSAGGNTNIIRTSRSADSVFLSCFTSPLITPTCSGGFPSSHRGKGDVTAASHLVVSCRAPRLVLPLNET
ncbi:hypothetical protein EYF80_017707 [Liparis tanakae]|uniref:Uncharacterized protein n=1 Tax=Liparis tanakae TaxID=230148 RepID=A0A4Z2I2S4_9TELE|nr:hypothetical protein EYF80_017707 [Liparis tanakae]